MSNNITVRDGNGLAEIVKTVETGGVHTPVHRIEGYDAAEDMVKVKSVQKKWRDSFTVVGAPDTAKWDTVIGSGGSASIVTAGVLRMINGSTTANSQTTVTSKETFTVPFRVSVGFTLSTRAANSTFYIEAVSVDPVTLAPDGLHSLAWAFQDTTATNAIYEVQNGGLARLRSAASTVVTTATSGVYELEAFADEAWFHSATLDATTGRTNSYRRHQQIPDPNALYKVRLRWLNGASAPVSPTNADIQYLSVQDYAELTAEITAGRGNSVAGNAMNVTPVGTTTVSGTVTTNAAAGTAAIGDVGVQYRANATGAATLANVNCPATAAAQQLKSGAGRLLSLTLTNTNAAARFIKLFNALSASVTPGTTSALAEIAIPPNRSVVWTLEGGAAFSTGITVMVTGGQGLTNNTAVTAGDVTGIALFA